ncbi:hypothetical protein V496_03416 [Pseudogymnoascus sp. VKM F-4515 (FW-2607)]|nr:hypothetical protein V496_03416 [Pseudogymnoascus sp. VKM F-4515 (FW-2607)]KFY99877.1 hypothetical protein V498_00444 [Pseudogymnoascus sp. VKM F-4517 (FW-2822)]
MPKLIAGRKRKAGHVEITVADDHYPNSSASICIASSPVTRSLTRSNGLCGRCARLDLENIAPSQSRSVNGNLVTSLRWSSVNKTLLRLDGSDEYIVRQDVDEGLVRTLEQNNIKFNIVKDWISMCKDMHTKTCAVEAPSPNTIPFFKLIECETLRIVPAPNEPYVALSYVWGESKPQTPELDRTPELDPLSEKIPHTIKDAITVTLQLGFRYLWVDRYCNSQNRGELEAQILKMDLVYRNAKITIIACAGENSDFGFPGKLFCGGEGIGYFPRGIGRGPWEVIERIEEYSLLSVNLTDPSDILEGILGILSAFERGTLKLRHHAGIPFLPPRPKVARLSRDNWTSSMGFSYGLCWDLEKPSTKRDGFPSWSWTGWEKPVVRWGLQNYEWDRIKVDNDIQVFVETRKGQLIDLEESYQQRNKPQPVESLSNIIQVTAWVSSLRILKKVPWRGDDVYEMKIKLDDGGYVYWRFKPTTCSQMLPERMAIGIHVAYKSESDNHPEATATALLVVGKVGATYERLGFGWVDQSHCDRYDKVGKDVNEDEDGYSLFLPPWALAPLGLVRSRTTIMLG